METRAEIISRIRAHLPFASESDCEVHEDSVLADLGVGSLHLITMLLALQEEYGIDPQKMVDSGMPATVGELVALIESRTSV